MPTILATAPNSASADATTAATAAKRRTAVTSENAPLGNRENARQKQASKTTDFTKNLWRIQRAMWETTAKKRFRDCHRAPIPAAKEVTVTRSGKGGRGVFAGLQNSHSVWSSPVAAVGIAQGRQIELHDAVNNWLGGDDRRAVAMVTLTVRHRHHEDLKTLLKGVSKAWRAVSGNAKWKGAKGMRRRYGVAHSVWFLEITHGRNGWHPHRHMVLFLDRALDADAAAALKAELHALWAEKVADLGLLAPNEEHGVDVQQVTAGNTDAAGAVATYAAKGMFAGLASEATGGATKQARNGNRTPFQILEDIADAKDAGEEPQARDVALWREYEEATMGARQRVWSPGAMEALGVTALDDNALAALEEQEPEEEPEEPTALVAIDIADWKKHLGMNIYARLEVLEAANAGDTAEAGARAVATVLERLGVPYRRVMVKHEYLEPGPRLSADSSDVTRAEARAVLG